MFFLGFATFKRNLRVYILAKIKAFSIYEKKLFLMFCEMSMDLMIRTKGHLLLKVTSRGRYPGIYVYKKGHKFCTKCRNEKELIEFHGNKASWDGKSSHCNKCRNKHGDTYRARPEVAARLKEYNKRYDKEYREIHKESLLASHKRSYKKRWPKRKIYNDLNYALRRETLIEYSIEYAKNNRDKRRKASAKYFKQHKTAIKKHRAAYLLEDKVIAGKLCIGSNLVPSDLPLTMIELKRALILLNREHRKQRRK